MGEALDRVPDGGGTVTLRGRLAAEEPLCKRFEDDGDGAAATATALLPAGEQATEASARASALSLEVGGTVVRIEGPVRVIAGSREATIGSRVAALRGRMLDRIGAADPEVAWTLSQRPAQVRLRSLSSGDRVRVSGRLVRADAAIEGGAKGYRDAGMPWCLVPEEGPSPALRVAFEGAPGGPMVRRATIAGAIGGVLVAVVIGVLMLPPLPPPPGEAVYRGKETPASVPVPQLHRNERFDPVVAALDEGDFEKASAAWPSDEWEGFFSAELHALAGRFEEGAASIEPLPDRVVDKETKACLIEAFRARGPAVRAKAALGRLRKLVESTRPTSTQRFACSLLLADLLPPAERLPILEALPPEGRGPLTRLRVLLTLEAGRASRQTPDDGTDYPYAAALLNRRPHVFANGILGVHITDALTQLPNMHGSRRFRMREAARAAFVLAAVGDVAGGAAPCRTRGTRLAAWAKSSSRRSRSRWPCGAGTLLRPSAPRPSCHKITISRWSRPSSKAA
ncbi:Hypothetical protein A7982_06368 [Minicystis rosea]|nr:Hypothetical protein A7982_06368 [Minicystis rosea]